jgi:hypothetical protein
MMAAARVLMSGSSIEASRMPMSDRVVVFWR